MKNKNNLSDKQRKELVIGHREKHFPSSNQARVYNDRPHTLTENGGGRVLTELANGEHRQISIPTRNLSSSYRAQADVLKAAAVNVMSEQNLKENSVSHRRKVCDNNIEESQKPVIYNRNVPATLTVHKNSNAVDLISLWYTRKLNSRHPRERRW